MFSVGENKNDYGFWLTENFCQRQLEYFNAI